MARIAGVNLPTNKRVVIALQYIHGIGPKAADDIMKKLNLPYERRVSQLTDAERQYWHCSHCKVWGSAVWGVRDGPAGPRVRAIIHIDWRLYWLTFHADTMSQLRPPLRA